MASDRKGLVDAVESSDVKLLKETLSQGADVNMLVGNGSSLLGKAIEVGNEEVIQIIIDAKNYLPPEVPNNDLENFTSSDSFDWDSLKHNDEQYGHSSTAQHPKHPGLCLFHSLRKSAIRRNGCDVNLSDFVDRTPIYYAVESMNVSIIQKLLRAGSSVNVSDINNFTPLHIAVSTGSATICDLLLRAGSRVNCKIRDSKKSALHVACSEGFLSIAQLLLSYGADMESLDIADQTPLISAVVAEQYEVVNFLLQKGAKVNIEEAYGDTPLALAVYRCDIKVAEVLLKSGAHIHRKHNLLHCAVEIESLQLCELLLNYGASTNDRNDVGLSALHFSIRQRQFCIFKLLVEHGRSHLNRRYIIGETTVHALINEFECPMEIETFSKYLDVLIQFGANLNQETETSGDTSLFRSIVLQKYQFTEILIRQGCNPNLGHVYSCDIDGLALLIIRKQYHCIKLFIYSGCVEQTRWTDIKALQNPSWKDISSFLMNIKTNPMALSKICRIAVRKEMGFGIISKVHKLPLPSSLKSFIVFEDSDFI